MGRVVVTAKVENLEDLIEHRNGRIGEEEIRTEVTEAALVDTGATMFSLPKSMIERLGLVPHRKRTGRTTAGVVSFPIYSPVRLTIQGRDCMTEVAELPDDSPTLIGQIPLEMLNFVVDPRNQRLIGNPEHGGEHMIDMF
jgi:predicted aspartyl protease